ncbi:hypothetical protein JS532_05360 [Bifidobacterium callimiconis]|uniref:hypothetical protein n=1 Tax=Bifidobacterium callimiconis TaxID=2306973 RepID=UPI001BDCC452|nr:hypothetical protein [Bifidobacterium callimiconis]MBT1176999.1 hypothetical protein [Bifidobacterium callimiconis]
MPKTTTPPPLLHCWGHHDPGWIHEQCDPRDPTLVRLFQTDYEPLGLHFDAIYGERPTPMLSLCIQQDGRYWQLETPSEAFDMIGAADGLRQWLADITTVCAWLIDQYPEAKVEH